MTGERSAEVVIEETPSRASGTSRSKWTSTGVPSDERDVACERLDWIYRSAIRRRFAAENMLTCDPGIATLTVHWSGVDCRLPTGIEEAPVVDRDELVERFASDLDAIPGDILTDSDADDVGIERVSVRIAAYFAEEGKVTNQNFFGSSCSTRFILDVAGSSVTGVDGLVAVSLNAFHCLDKPVVAGGTVLRYESPLNVIATPRSIPCFVTAKVGIANQPGGNDDVHINLRARDASGSPLEGVRIYWRCMVPTYSDQA
ncbi:hypothetical protein [Pseudonocardia sp. NPDC049154]|uniref:hypothetical protein n=1 Tax=Pseudonocardia sp. NPDC049154 TaxID=3155501 RepID=UPI0033F8B238